jgi:hypothetical protein
MTEPGRPDRSTGERFCDAAVDTASLSNFQQIDSWSWAFRKFYIQTVASTTHHYRVKKAKVSLCLTMHQDMKTYGGVDVYLQAF